MEIYGLLGEKLSHSMSPYIFKILFKKYNINGTYSLFEINKSNFDNAIVSAKTLGIGGVNVTIPYKIDIINQLDIVDDSVKKIGACNCIKFDENGANGFNTDYFGALKALQINDVNVKDKDCVILGSGGASRSFIVLLNELGAKSIKVVQRVKHFEDKGIVSYIDYDEFKKIEKSYLLVNTTPIGMYPNILESPVDDQIKNFEVCFDAVYNPIETKFLKDAKVHNIKTIDGLYMLIAQAIKAFNIFSNIEVSDSQLMSIYAEVSELLEKKI